MSHSAIEIANLLYRYAERLDGGDLEGVAELFAHAHIKMRDGDALLGAPDLLRVLRERVKCYPCGTPRTKHVVTNPIIEIDEVSNRATARSYYTVLQATDGLAPLGAITTRSSASRTCGAFRFATIRCWMRWAISADI